MKGTRVKSLQAGTNCEGELPDGGISNRVCHIVSALILDISTGIGPARALPVVQKNARLWAFMSILVSGWLVFGPLRYWNRWERADMQAYPNHCEWEQGICGKPFAPSGLFAFHFQPTMRDC